MKPNSSKKAIILFVTLMFILVISSLILKNLDDTNKYIDESNKDIISVKALLAVKNIKEEFLNYFVKNKNDINTLLENGLFKDELVLEYADIKANVRFEKYEEKHDINLLNQKEEKLYKDIEDLFANNNISDFYTFRQIVIQNNKKYGDIENFTQLKQIINEFIKTTNSKQIIEIEGLISFQDTSISQLVLCNMDILVSNELIKSEFLYDLTNKSIKGFNIVFQ